MKTLLIAMLAGVLATSALPLVSTNAMADQTWTLGDSFAMDTVDSCKLDDKNSIECSAPDGTWQATIMFNGVVKEGTDLTQEEQRLAANSPALKAKAVEVVKDRVMKWLIDADATMSSTWNGPISDVLPYGKLYVSYAGLSTANGYFMISTQIWHKGKAYEMNVFMNDGEGNLKAFVETLNTIRLN